MLRLEDLTEIEKQRMDPKMIKSFMDTAQWRLDRGYGCNRELEELKRQIKEYNKMLDYIEENKR